MATNKRKESAALFELIGKSTLKVPKHAAALKVPEWWSSKTNPPATPPKIAAIATEKEAPSTTIEPDSPPQPRLFDPPPANTPSTASPSIRPPASASSSTPITALPLHSPAPASTPPPAKPSNPVRIFAPQTMDQGTVSRRKSPLSAPSNQDYRRQGRVPPWAIILGSVLLILIVSTILAALQSWYKSRTSLPTHSPATPLPHAPPPPTASLLPSSPQQLPAQLPPPSNTPPESSAKGTVYGPGAIQRSPDLYYVIITQTPTASVAQKDADFLADHGIDLSIETSTGPGGKGFWYRLVTVQGYPTLVAADPFRKKIVLIGHHSDEFKKGKKMWDDAYLARVKSLPAQ